MRTCVVDLLYTSKVCINFNFRLQVYILLVCSFVCFYIQCTSTNKSAHNMNYDYKITASSALHILFSILLVTPNIGKKKQLTKFTEINHTLEFVDLQ